LLLRSNFGAVAEQAVYTDQGLLVDCAAGKMYFIENDKAVRCGFTPKVKRLKKYLWPGEEYMALFLKGANVIILIIGF
jgi:hypothetical protein